MDALPGTSVCIAVIDPAPVAAAMITISKKRIPHPAV
jgi:hypothetical protein